MGHDTNTHSQKTQEAKVLYSSDYKEVFIVTHRIHRILGQNLKQVKYYKGAVEVFHNYISDIWLEQEELHSVSGFTALH